MDNTTILFTDIEGSTPLLERLGDDRWLDMLHQHNDIVRAHVYAQGGREVKAQGDGFMLAFDDTCAALTCAGAIQRSLSFVGRDHVHAPVRVRIGADRGPVMREGDDLFGLHVNLAAHITDAARGGEILASTRVRDDSEAAGELQWGRSRSVKVRGLVQPVRVASLEWNAPRQWAKAQPARSFFRPALVRTWLF